jgi:hypothetical protein
VAFTVQIINKMNPNIETPENLSINNFPLELSVESETPTEPVVKKIKKQLPTSRIQTLSLGRRVEKAAKTFMQDMLAQDIRILKKSKGRKLTATEVKELKNNQLANTVL